MSDQQPPANDYSSPALGAQATANGVDAGHGADAPAPVAAAVFAPKMPSNVSRPVRGTNRLSGTGLSGRAAGDWRAAVAVSVRSAVPASVAATIGQTAKCSPRC